MILKNPVFLFISIYILTLSCSDGSSAAVSSVLRDYTPSEVHGWNLDETNTGIAASGLNETELTEFDLNGPDAGKGEWIAGERCILYLYGNQIIEKKIITFTSYMKAVEGGTVIKNCIIRPSDCADGMAMVSIAGGTIENCEIDGSSLGLNNIAHTGISASDSVIRNCLIHDCDCGIMAGNNSGLTLIENNYIYNIFYQAGSDDHLAGCSIWSASGDGIGVFNNRVIIDDQDTVGHTSAAFFSQSLRGKIANVRVEGNLLVSPGYVARITWGGNATSLPFSFINNRMKLIPGGFGYYAGSTDIQITPEWSENYIYNSNADDGKGDLITAVSVNLK